MVTQHEQLQFDSSGLVVAVAPQGLFTAAGARPALTLTWPEITALSATDARPGSRPATPSRILRSVINIVTMRLDLADRLAIGTPTWTMTVGVRVAAAELMTALEGLLATIEGPAPALTAT